jgi:pimeloyl-ACP methyl ester carboxylesterase
VGVPSAPPRLRPCTLPPEAPTHGLLASLHPLQLVLAGHDWGGHLAWCLAYAAPHLFSALVTLCIPHPGLYHTNRNWLQRVRHWLVSLLACLLSSAVRCLLPLLASRVMRPAPPPASTLLRRPDPRVPPPTPRRCSPLSATCWPSSCPGWQRRLCAPPTTPCWRGCSPTRRRGAAAPAPSPKRRAAAPCGFLCCVWGGGGVGGGLLPKKACFLCGRGKGAGLLGPISMQFYLAVRQQR